VSGADVTFEIYGPPGQATIQLIQGPDNLIDNAKAVPMPSVIDKLSSWPPPNPVQSYGEALLKCLNDIAEQSIKDAIKHVVDGNGTIYFKLKSADWESHAWEALWDDTDFFLLKPQRGMARVVDPRDRSSLAFALEPPLRVMAVLSAAGLRNGPQWEALYRAAIDNARSDYGLPLQLHLLTGEEGLADAIRGSPDSNPRLRVTVANIDGARSLKVSNEIKRFRPHILHFFCHGQVVQGAGVLRISDIDQHRESISSRRPDGAPLSFAMDNRAFREIFELARAQRWLWLVVLNACKLGAQAPNVFALAQKFAIAGVPAAIGMAEVIDENDAIQFCKAFYSSLFLELANVDSVLATADECALDWAKLLHEARKSIRDGRGSASSKPQWTLPIVFVGGHDFRLKKPSTPRAPDLASAIPDLASKILEGALEQLRNAPASVLESIRKVEVK
jgi:hypothetical protein